MATISKANADAQRKQLQDDPSIQFGNMDARGVAVGNKTTPGGVNLSATIYPSTTDQQGKTVQGASGLIDKINQGLQQQTYGDQAPADNSWWDNLQDAIGSMGVGAKHGGGTYVPYSGQQLAYEQKMDTENQAYGKQYMDYLTGENAIKQQNADTTAQKVAAGTPAQAKTDALSKVQSAISSWHDQGYTQAQVEKMIDNEADVLTKSGITAAQAHAYAVQLYKDEGTVKGKPGPPGPPGAPSTAPPPTNTGGLLGMLKGLL